MNLNTPSSGIQGRTPSDADNPAVTRSNSMNSSIKPLSSASLRRTPRSARTASASAFTLVEVIVVIVIIAVLAGLVVPRLVGRIGDSKQGAAKSSAATLANQVRVLMVDAGGLPPDVSIRALFEKPGDLDLSKWKGPYVDSIDKLNDPWGKPYVLVVPGQKNVDFDVISYGADGKPGGEGENADVVMP